MLSKAHDTLSSDHYHLEEEDSMKRVEKMKRECEYMDHIIRKVKNHFNMDPEAALIDVEIFMSKLSKQKKT